MNYKSAANWIFRNLANIVTLAGFPLCFVLLWVVINREEWIWTILLLVLAVYATDFIDGKAARYFKIVSKFGSAADRLRDKFLLGIMFFFFLSNQKVDLSLKIIIIPLSLIEIMLLGMWFLGVFKNINVSANKYGQTKMFLMSGAILLGLLNLIAEEYFGQKYHIPAIIAINAVLLVSLFYAARSLLGHRSKYLSQISAK